MSINPVGPNGNRQQGNAYKNFAENGLSAIRDRDELFVRLRYTF